MCCSCARNQRAGWPRSRLTRRVKPVPANCRTSPGLTFCSTTLQARCGVKNVQVLQLRVLTAGRPAALAIDAAAALQLRRAEVSLMAAAHRKACRSLPGHGSTLECVRVRPVLICMGVCLGVYMRALERESTRESTRCVRSLKEPCGAPGHKVSGVCESIRCLVQCLVPIVMGALGP